MTNSTPNLVAWLVEYRKYLMLVADGASDEAALLKLEIEEGLNWANLVGLTLNLQIILISRPTPTKEGVTSPSFSVTSML